MRRQDSSSVPHSRENVPFVHSISQKADNVASVVDTAAVDSDRFLEFGAFDNNLPENIIPEPKLDTILADVASKLPSIDFDLSDVSFAD